MGCEYRRSEQRAGELRTSRHHGQANARELASGQHRSRSLPSPAQPQNEQRGLCISLESGNSRPRSKHEAALAEVAILRDDRVAGPPAIRPEHRVRRTTKSERTDMCRSGIVGAEKSDQFRTEILVEEQLHSTEVARRRSRSAAKAKHARMSSRVRSGKSASIRSLQFTRGTLHS